MAPKGRHSNLRLIWRSLLFVLASAWLLSLQIAVAQPGPGPPACLPYVSSQALEGSRTEFPPDFEEIVFAARSPGKDTHYYANFGYFAFDPNRKVYGEGGRLCRLNLRTGRLTVLVDDPRGGVRDPQVHYDGQKVLFSYRKGGTPNYHLHEIQIDGSGLRQLTDGPYDDIEPTYLPDGGILFCSSRCRRWVNCWPTEVAVLHRCDGDGSNLRILSSNNQHDNTPWVLPDGRVLYTRWEYVDRNASTCLASTPAPNTSAR